MNWSIGAAALADLDAIFDLIEPDSPRRAASYVADIRSKCRLSCEHPMLGPARDEIRPGLRILPIFGRIVVCHRIIGDKIVIARILYAGRDYEAVIDGDADF